ncbi:glycosyltransferase [Cognatiyoonia koreensis]|nr:glycosyltransferase [Cognatiyoonia koreensis]
MSDRLNFDAQAPHVPSGLVAEALDASRDVKEPDRAKAAFERLAPALQQYQPDRVFSVSCAMLVEKQRNTDGMLEFWSDLRGLFPDDQTALRMMMRWYRRERRVSSGIAKLHLLFPESHSDVDEAESACLGFAELRAFDEIDRIMDAVLPAYPDARAIRMRYIKILNQQTRYLEAKAVADSVADVDKMGPSSRDLIDTAQRRAAKMALLYSNDAADTFARIIAELPVPERAVGNALGAITFYTGQLGTGGAERQMTRIASAFQAQFQRGQTVGGLALTAPTDVVVKHTTPETGADFYVPVLRRARVMTTSLANVAPVPLDQLKHVTPEVINLLELLPGDVFETTCKLIPHFQERRTQIAYIWQDGGVLFATLAALIAGVPRILTSFRGLPPNLRPNLFRPELPVLYKALAALPHVTFSANSQIAATAYEDWLGLPAGTVIVLPNAMLPVLPDGEPEDATTWDRIVRASADCTQTVLGVFRFDDNKRPLFWIDVAAAHLKRQPDTRFVIVGTGYQFAACRSRIAELGLTDRIFLTGVQENVGFFMHKADLVMHLAQMEGLPNVLIEAQLAGVPVLATPAGGTGEVISDGATGHILPDADAPVAAEVAARLTAMLSDSETLELMGDLAATTAPPRFLLDHILDRTAALFSQTEEASS